MAFIGGPMDGQQVTPDTVDQAQQGGALDLESLIAGMGGGGPGGDPGMGGPGGPPPGDDPGASDDPAAAEGKWLSDALSSLTKVSGGGSLSEQSKAKIQAAMTTIQQVLAAEEKERHDAFGGKVSPRLMEQAQSGGGAPSGPPPSSTGLPSGYGG